MRPTRQRAASDHSRRLKKRSARFWVAAFFLATGVPVVLLMVLPAQGSMMMLKAWRTSIREEQAFRWQYDWVNWNDISPNMALAAIAAEDQKFPDHFGFDWQSIERAAAHNVHNKRVHGASTITQQVAKNLFFPFTRSYVRKIIEAYFTVWIEVLWPKQRILEMYLNIAEFGPGIFGVEAASQHYFQHSARRLTTFEAAHLAALLPDPKRYAARRNGRYVQTRTRTIQLQMQRLGMTTVQQLPEVPGWLSRIL